MLNFNDIFVDDTKYGMKIPKEKYLSVGLYPVIDQSKEQIAGYTDESEGIYCDVPAIIFGDHTRIIKYIDVPFFLGADGTKLLKIKDNTAFNCKYLYYALSNAKIPNTGYNRHFKWLKELSFNIPSIEKQREIADLMDIIVNLENLRKKQLEKLELFVKSRFIEMFGEISVNSKHWKESRLEDLIIGKASNGFFAKPDKYSNDGKIGVICVGDVVNRKYSNINNLRRINMDEVSFKKYKVTYGDMLFCRSSLVKEGIAKASIVPKNSENAVFECHVIRIKLNTSIIVPEYMQAFSTTDYFRNQMIRMSKTATMTTIGQKDIISSSVLVPPIDIQNQFVDFMAQVDKSKLAIQQSLDELETLKKSLMQQYFG